MNRTRTTFGVLAAAAGVFGLCLTLNADPPRTPAAGPRPGTKAGPADDQRVPVKVARDRARLMHGIYAATLDSMHHHFFRRDRAVLPARAMEDVFAEVDRQSGMKSKWVAVNTPAMSINHEPETAFEKAAAAALGAGAPDFERVEAGHYLRAGGIPLGAGCLSCHTRFGTAADKTPRFAGLVISIPVKDE